MKNNQKMLIFVVLCTMFFVLWSAVKYWTADYYYNYGKNYNSAGKPETALNYLVKAVKNVPNQPLYKNELAITYALLSKNDKKYAEMADQLTTSALTISPNNTNLLRTQFGIYIRLAEIDQNYLLKAKNSLDQSILRSPNDPKLYYNLGLMYARVGQYDEAKKILEKAIELKPNYEDPKKALELIETAKEP